MMRVLLFFIGGVFMTIKECIDIVDNIKPNQYGTKEKVQWLSFIDEIIINDVLKTHEGYDGKYDDFAGYTEDKLSVPLIVSSPYDRLYPAYLKMKIDGENGETARYNNSAAEFNTYLMEYRKYYNKTHLPLTNADKNKPAPKKTSVGLSDAEFENLKRELYALLSEDVAQATSNDKIYDIVMNYVNNNAQMLKGRDGLNGVNGEDGYTPRKGIDYFDGKDGKDADLSKVQTSNGTIVSQNADFAEVAEWWDGNPTNEDRTGYFVCANVPVDGVVMKKATSTDDVKGVSILAPAFAGNYTKDKLDANGNLLPKYSYVAIIGFVPVIDNGTCEVGGRCMPDDNGCAIPSSNSMGYQVVNRIDANRVLIIIEPNGDMVQRIKTKVNNLQEAVSGKADVDIWEHIDTITTTEDTKHIEFDTEPNGTRYRFKKLFIKVSFPSGGNGNMYFNIIDRRNPLQTTASVSYMLLSHKLGFAYYCPIGEFMVLETHSDNGAYSQFHNYAMPIKMPYVDLVRIQGNGTILTGTTFEIWGVRA